MRHTYITCAFSLLLATSSFAQMTAFKYQGSLTDNGSPANGNFQMQFKLFDAVSGGTQSGSTLGDVAVTAANGVFSARLDFGASPFTGANRWLEIAVRRNSGDAYTTLSPREQIASSPYAVRTLSAAAADSLSASCVGCVTNPQINSVSGSKVTGAVATATNATTATTATNAAQLGGVPAIRYVATDTNGRVGIGTSAPSTKLEVVDPVRQLRFGPTTADNGGYLISTAPHQSIIAGGGSWDAPNWIARDTMASLTAHQFGTIQFYTNNNLTVGSSFEPTVQMHIAANGFVGIGTDAPLTRLHVVAGSTGDGVNGVSINGDGLRGDSTNFAGVSGYSVNGSGVYGSSNHFAGFFQGNVFVTGTVTQGSDARLKQNISKLGYGLSEVLRLRPVSWRWKEHPETGQQLGLVAQEVEEVMPDLVSTSKDAEAMKGLNYIGLVPILVNAIKEQQAQIEKQAEIINQLEVSVCRRSKKAARCR